MKYLLYAYISFMLIFALLVPKSETTKPTVAEESNCKYVMCESLGGSDTIALEVMFGNL